MDMFNFFTKNFNWLQKAITQSNFWIVVLLSLWIGWQFYGIVHDGEIKKLNALKEELQMKEERLNAQMKQSGEANVLLNPLQQKILSYIYNYQTVGNLPKVIISKDGTILDDKQGSDTDKNVIRDIMNRDTADKDAQSAFENLLLSIPEKYLKIIPETRWGSPFVVKVTEDGIKYLSMVSNK